MRELYIYYRVSEAHQRAAAQAVAAMQQQLRARHAGLQARLLRRPETRDGLQTWMETYCRPGTGIDAVLEQDIASAARALDAWVDGARHVEVFEELSPACA